MNQKYKRRYKRLQKTFQNSFPRYNEILNYLDLLKIIYPSHVRIEKIGSSIQGRPIRMVILQADLARPKSGVMIEAGIHAREWLSHTSILYLIHTILKTKTLLNYMDFYVIPCINPDGYEYTHTNFRLWRKNLNTNGSKKVNKWGVDLNRNFPVAFGCQGSSSDRSSALYRGKHPLSEPESQSVANALKKYSYCLKLYISVHCHGHLIMYPWAHTTDSLGDEEDLLNCAIEAQRAMKDHFPRSKFRVGQLSKVMYIAAGTTTDYVRSTHKIKFAFTMELHKRGRSGFEPKRGDILNVARETFAGIEAMVKYVYRYYTHKNPAKRKRSNSCNNLPKRTKYF